MAHLYLHIPFCRRACHYCDFHFSTNLQAKSAVVGGIVQEIYLQKNYLKSRELSTIYFGGGTPSLLNINELYDIFEAINACFTVAEGAEITLEANPDDITPERLAIWKRFGINRLSIGIQSFNPHYLTHLNRIHTADMALKSVKSAQDAGITNLTVDLIYGINPNNAKKPKRKPRNPLPLFTEQQLQEAWEADLETVFSLNIPHISSYCLTVEEKTAFGSWVKNGEMKPVDDEFSAKQFLVLQSRMRQNDYEQYEISNFAKNGQYARHNTAYWQGEEYLGVGPSAHSFNGISRQFNVSNNAAYIAALDEGKIPFTLEVLTPENRFNELIMTGLRTQWGVDIEQLRAIKSLSAEFVNTLNDYEKNGQVTRQNGRILLTDKGKLLADGIAADLFTEE